MSTPSSAIQKGKLVRTSASQITTFTSCARKWLYQYWKGIKPPQSKSQEKGELIHKQLEDYYKNLDVSYLKSPSTRFLIEEYAEKLPKPGPNVLVEYPASRTLHLYAHDVEIVGRIDLFVPGPKTDIYDFKTSSNFSYNKAPDQLINDVQMTVYGKFAVEQHEARVVKYHHAYVGTKKVEAEVVSTREVPAEEVTETFKSLIADNIANIKETLALAQEDEDMCKVEGNLKHCGAYGGCPFKSQCPTYLNSIESYDFMQHKPTEEDIMNLSELMKNSRTNATPGPRATGINPPDASKPEALPEKKELTPDSLTLFINCLPENVTYTRLESLIEERARPICQVAGVNDVRQVKFGEGKTALLDSFRRSPPSGLIVAQTSGLSLDVLEILIPRAALVIRGV